MYIQDIKKEFFDVVIGGRVLVLGTVYFFVGLIITDSKELCVDLDPDLHLKLLTIF